MKKIKILLPLFIVIGLLNSCNEDDSSTQTEVEGQKMVQLVSFKLSDNNFKDPLLSTSGTMLSFETFADYEQTVNNLEQQMEDYDDAFLRLHNNLTEEQLDDLEDSIGYNPQQPLINFEEAMGFTNSLRKRYNQLEEAWLNNEELDPATDPDNTILFDEIEQILWNENQEIMIGGKVFVLGKESSAYQISANYAPNLEIINRDEDVSNNPDVETTEKGGNDCKTWKGVNDFDPYAPDRKIKRHLAIRSVSWLCNTNAKIVSYKKKGHRWKKRRTSIGVTLNIYLRDQYCSGTVRSGSKSKSVKNRRRRSVNMTEWGQSPAYRAKNGQSIYGTFYRGGTSSSKVMAW